MGCGKPPESWDAVAYDGEDGSESYAFAELGFVHEALGRRWPWCPRWFASKAPQEAVLAFNAIMAVLRRARRSLPQEVELTAAGEDLVLLVADYWDRLETDRLQREDEERKKKARGRKRWP